MDTAPQKGILHLGSLTLNHVALTVFTPEGMALCILTLIMSGLCEAQMNGEIAVSSDHKTHWSMCKGFPLIC